MTGARVLTRRRSTLQLTARTATKVHATAAAAQADADWHRRFPWASPRLLEVDGRAVTVERRPLARDLSGWRPVDELRALLTRLHAAGVHHRDVHVGNIVVGSGGAPLLIDWETAIEQPAPCSYDLHGPDASGVPVPEIHAGLPAQWWGSPQAMSISRQWEA